MKIIIADDDRFAANTLALLLRTSPLVKNYNINLIVTNDGAKVLIYIPIYYTG